MNAKINNKSTIVMISGLSTGGRRGTSSVPSDITIFFNIYKEKGELNMKVAKVLTPRTQTFFSLVLYDFIQVIIILILITNQLIIMILNCFFVIRYDPHGNFSVSKHVEHPI